MKSIRNLMFLTSLVWGLSFLSCAHSDHTLTTPPAEAAVAATPAPNPLSSMGRNSVEAMQKPIVLMISIDGFRHDYLEKFNPPNLNMMAREGLRARSMVPSFPTLTFPNHITLVTGRVPGHHGIVSNRFYDKVRQQIYSMGDGAAVKDGTWYQAEPIWNVVEKAKMVSAIFFWVGSEADIGGMHPTYYVPYDGAITNGARVDQVIDWLKLPEDRRPHFLGLYFSDVDSMGHKYGPDSAETRKAVMEIDAQIGRLNAFVQASKLPVNILVMSDHGMQQLDPAKRVIVGQLTDLSGFVLGDRGPVMMLYSNDQARVEKAYQDLKKAEKGFHVYRHNEVPKKFVYDHPNRTGDLVLIADLPYYLTDQDFTPEKPMSAATHGWSFEYPSVHAFFIAKGPQIKKGTRVNSFSNVHVFPFALELLGLRPTQPIDGNGAVLRPFIQR